jgi:hypothetical protein
LVTVAAAGWRGEVALEAPTVETTQIEQSPVSASAPVMVRMEVGVSEMSTKNVVVGQVPVPMSPTSAAIGRTILEEALPQEVSASPSDDAGPS